MNQTVSKRDDPAPRRIRGRTGLSLEQIGGLADNLEITNDRVLDDPFLHEPLTPRRNVRVYGFDAVEDVPQIRPIGLQNGRASASMNGRK